ncbi:RHS repeat domain-containing protein, partial [Longitalea luteola]|uniref:RHS repeat domain-containing protein n=1 Tax=Longitalea luteola TaxID=2812563 RepID=UPI00272DE408
ADFNQWVSGSGATAIFNKSANIDFSVTGISYDPNGNLLTMNQKGLKGSTSPLIDQLTYGYLNNSNKLNHVTDAASDPNTTLGDFKDGSNGAGADYNYDINGNLIQDNNKAISNIAYNYLNLPSVITVTGKGTITYTYDAAGNKLKKEIAENGQPLKTILYTGGAVYENDRLQFMMHEEGRIRALKDANDNITGFTFDYFLKDHLGNVRMVLTEEQAVNMYPAATMETASVAVEEALYRNVNDATRSNKPAGYPSDTSDNPNEKVAKLRGDGQKIGPAIVLKVMPGDKFNVRVNSWYRLNGVTPGKPVSPLNELAMALAASVGRGPGGKIAGQQLSPAKMFNIGALEFLKDQRYNSSRPKAYLNWILFDDQLQYVSGGVDQVGIDQELKKHQFAGVPINKSGFLYIYVSNETPNIDVFFDNLQVTHLPGPVLEETHYYPFGLTMAGISSKALGYGEPENKLKYNGIEKEDGLDIEMYDAQLRELDPQIGRWWEIDPKIEDLEMWSPYASNFNNPIRFSDPLGDKGQTCCKELWKDIKDAAVETGKSLYDGAVTVAREINTTINPLTPVVELVTGKSAESDFQEDKSRAVSGVQTAMIFFPVGRVEQVATKVTQRGVVSLDNNALIKAVEGGGKDAVIKSIGSDKPIVSITAAKEFLAKGDKQQLKSFMIEIGATIGKNGASANQVQWLQAKAASLGRKLHTNDASIVGGAINNNASVLTNDKRLINFLQAFGVPFKTH